MDAPRKFRFRVVDDVPTMRRFIKQSLRELGYTQVSMAADGDAAMALLKSRSFDLVLTDWNMPGMPGLELLRQVRADERLAKLPVLMLTAEAKREHIVEAIEAGVSGYVVKPFSAKTLQEKIDKMLQAAAA
jgi:two-component system, chemotaxis family, chemotaxis protein CheY